VLANSHHVRRSVERPGGPTVVVVDNPVDPTSERVLVLVGQITPWKGQDTAIRALADLPDRHGCTRLLIVGEPVFSGAGTRFDNVRYRDDLIVLARDLGVADRVLFLGARRDVPDVVGAADVALVPSWEEPFGRVVIEAMAAAIPVVATEVGGPPEILARGGGLLVPPRRPERWAETITRLLDNPTLRARLAADGRREAVSRYALARFVERVLDGYEIARRARGVTTGATGTSGRGG
jgi:glycosyltransferase involved in cell wall biosynthesis